MKFSNNFYKKISSELVILTVMFLFFIQLVGDLIESIYMLDLLNLELDENVLGLLFLLTPFILLVFRHKVPNYFLETVIVITIISRLISPFLDTTNRIISAGLGVGCFMLFLPLYFSQHIKNHNMDEVEKLSLKFGAGLASAILLSITFRTLNSSVDISTYGIFQIIGWFLAVIAILSIIGRIKVKQIEGPTNTPYDEKIHTKGEKVAEKRKNSNGIKLLALGIISALTLNYFAFSSPTVISRWTEGNYIFITIAIALMITLTIYVLTFKPNILGKLNSRGFWSWNVLFAISLFLTITVHTFQFPASSTSDPIIINHPLYWFYYIPLVVMIALLPIVFIDFVFLSREIIKRRPSPSKLGLGFGAGGLFLILVSFILIFTNVWGYIEPVSPIFRNLFWLPFLLLIAITLSNRGIFTKRLLEIKNLFTNLYDKLVIALFLTLLVIGTSVSVIVWESRSKAQDTSGITSLTVMTYNIQQGVNTTGDKNYEKQLAVIKNVNPDIIGLQESDTARISGGNSDLVRYFATRLNYYSFYGPRTVTGTFGAAILSRFPITNAKTIFTYSDEDEIGTTEVQIRVGTTIFNVYVNHPAGSDDAKLAHIEGLMDQLSGKTNVISMGDFNSRENSIYYNMSVSVLQDVWLTQWPSGVDDNGLDMSDRIDHIFVSLSFTVLETRFITDSQSDHPALYTEIQF